jgi:hypothetical protein
MSQRNALGRRGKAARRRAATGLRPDGWPVCTPADASPASSPIPVLGPEPVNDSAARPESRRRVLARSLLADPLDVSRRSLRGRPLVLALGAARCARLTVRLRANATAASIHSRCGCRHRSRWGISAADRRKTLHSPAVGLRRMSAGAWQGAILVRTTLVLADDVLRRANGGKAATTGTQVSACRCARPCPGCRAMFLSWARVFCGRSRHGMPRTSRSTIRESL